MVAINKARPVLASQADKVIKTMGAMEKTKALNFNAHKEKEIKSASIIPSRQSRSERKWVW